MQAMKHASEGSSMALKPGKMSLEVQNGGISGPTKSTDVIQNFLKIITNRKKDKSIDNRFNYVLFNIFSAYAGLGHQMF